MLLAVLVAAMPPASPARAQAPAAQPRPSAPAIVIVDGSGSMWANLGQDRASKIDLVRAALRQSLTPLGPQSRIGLMSFGPRCSDAEVVSPPDAGPGERLMPSVDKFNPRGKGPVALAIREAAKQVPAGTAASIILLHDGPDNCQQDPCAAAAEVAKANPKLVIDIISIGLEKADAQRMACVAKTTKGQMYEVRDASTLNAAVAEALRLANPDPAMGRAAPEVGLTAPAPTEAPGLRLTAALAGVGPALTVPVTWRVTKAEAPNDLVVKRSSPELSLNVAPGSYVVEASLGLAKARQVVEVGSKGRTSAQLGLAAGILKINGHADKDGNALADPIVTVAAISEGGGTSRAAETAVWIARDPTAEIVLPAGTYKVRIEDGLANKEMQVSVTPGNAVEAQMVLGTGRLELSAAANGGAEAMTDVVYTLAEDDPDAPQGRRDVARSADPAPVFILPAGTYYLSAQSGAAEVRDRIAVGSGTTVKHLLTFNAVKLSVAVQVDGTDCRASTHHRARFDARAAQRRGCPQHRRDPGILPAPAPLSHRSAARDRERQGRDGDRPAGRTGYEDQFQASLRRADGHAPHGVPGLRIPLAGEGRQGRDGAPLRRGRTADGPSCPRTLCRANTG